MQPKEILTTTTQPPIEPIAISAGSGVETLLRVAPQLLPVLVAAAATGCVTKIVVQTPKEAQAAMRAQEEATRFFIKEFTPTPDLVRSILVLGGGFFLLKKFADEVKRLL